MLTHRNLIAQICQTRVVGWIGSDSRVIAVAPFFHILGLAVVLLAGLHRGSTIVALPRFDLEQFLDCVQRYRIEYASLVPPIVLAFAKHR
jgi:acyl-CoA synthetase (AMP-forming)/AMP-acid ligase II